jgi:hypothetical protein
MFRVNCDRAEKTDKADTCKKIIFRKRSVCLRANYTLGNTSVLTSVHMVLIIKVTSAKQRTQFFIERFPLTEIIYESGLIGALNIMLPF